MATFRITYRNEIYIEAESEEEAISSFENLDQKELDGKSGFVEVVSVDQEQE